MRKRKKELKRKESPFSSSLRRIGEFIQKRDFPAALAKADQAIASSGGPDKARVLALVGDSEFKRGRFAEAAQIHLQAATESVNHVSLWLRPYIGQVRALLKVPQVNDALVMARHAVALAEAKMAEFNEQVRQAGDSVRANGSVEVPPVPLRVSVVATRMGYLFLQEGEPEAAEEFFQKAIESAKGGANRARQGLAQIALARGELGKAFNTALDAIRMGKSKAKTISAWSIMIAARRQIGGWKISDELIKGLDKAPAGLRARTTLHIIRELRKNDMRQWQGVAARWIAKEGHAFPKYEKEIRKLMLSSAKLVPNDIDGKREAAEQLLDMRVLGPKDWLMGAKEFVRTSLWGGKPVDIASLLVTAESKYGDHFVPRAAHSLALSCMMAKRHDLARPLLQANIQHCMPGSRTWGKSVWALARMENFLGNHALAAQGYRQYFESPRLPERFRLQAQLQWVKSLIDSGQSDALMEAKTLMTATLSGVRDPDVLMNFARQLQSGPSELKSWGVELFAQGEALALDQFNAVTHPAIAMAILFKLTRRQVIDFRRSKESIALWESFNAEKQDWLWSGSSCFWEYIGLIFEAYVRSGNAAKAEEFANEFMNDPAVPVNSVPFIGMPYASWLIQQKRAAEGLALCETLVRGSPNNIQCAPAWYWLALASYKHGDIEGAKKYAEQMRSTQGSDAKLNKGWALDARALLLLANMRPDHVDPEAVNYSMEFLKDQMNSLSYDLENL
jgi:tetratricopeptide (TPR) repeat protein